MLEVFGTTPALLFSQAFLGLINGSFYALLGMGLAIIFGMLHVINFMHGAQYMMGAFLAWGLLQYFGINYWYSLIIVPIVIGASGIVIEKLLISRLYKLDHLYSFLLTFGLALVVIGLFRNFFGSDGRPYVIPDALTGGVGLGFMFLPYYRIWIVTMSILVCAVVWFTIERTRLGAYLRAALENPRLVEAFGINVSLMVTLTYGLGVALAAFAGVLAAPIYSVNPKMGDDLLIIVFAVVVVGGMGSIGGAILAGLGLGLVEGLTKAIYPQAATTIIFVVMAIVLLLRPSVVVNRVSEEVEPGFSLSEFIGKRLVFLRIGEQRSTGLKRVLLVSGLVFLLLAPLLLYPILVMKILCFGLFAVAFNLLLGYGNLLSFGHAAFFGTGSYLAAHAAKAWGLTPELAILFGTFSAALVGLAVGSLTIRRSGIYFAMITLAFSQAVYFFFLQAEFTGGENGLQNVPRGRLFGLIDLGNDVALYYVVAAIFVISMAIVVRTVNSPFGQVLRAIRENEPRAISLGYPVYWYKLIVFVLSAALAGTAGATKAVVLQLATLTDAYWTTSGEPVLMALIGGVGTILGPVIGAATVVLMQNYLAGAAAWVTVIQGAIFVACVLMLRNGIMGLFSGISKK